MLKHISILVVLSFLILIFASQTQLMLSYLDMAHSLLNVKLSYIFNTSPLGNTLQETICLLLIPFLTAGVPAGGYWLVKRKLIPYFYHMVWIVWLVLFTSLILAH